MAGVIRKLSQETFVLNFRSATAALPALPGYVARLVDDHTLEVEVTKEQRMNDIFARLSQQGIEVVSMRNKVNRLEELFMRLVERKDGAGGGGGLRWKRSPSRASAASASRRSCGASTAASSASGARRSCRPRSPRRSTS